MRQGRGRGTTMGSIAVRTMLQAEGVCRELCIVRVLYATALGTWAAPLGCVKDLLTGGFGKDSDPDRPPGLHQIWEHDQEDVRECL